MCTRDVNATRAIDRLDKQFTLIIYESRVVIWGYFQVRYDSRVVNFDSRGFIRLATGDGSLRHLIGVATHPGLFLQAVWGAGVRAECRQVHAHLVRAQGRHLPED